jgi:hypothetical protein
LSFYLRQMVNAYLSFTPLYRPDMLDRLRRLRGQLCGIEVSLTHPEYLADDRGAFGTLLRAAFGQRAPSVGVRIGMGRRGPRDRFLDGATEESVFRIAEDAHDQVDRLIVFGRDPATGQTERVNLLSECVEVTLELAVRPDVPALPVAQDAFRELASAYRSFKLEGLFDRRSRPSPGARGNIQSHMRRIGQWLDRNLWSLPAAAFVLGEAGLSIWSASSKAPVLLAAASITVRTQVYSSLTGSASALLGPDDRGCSHPGSLRSSGRSGPVGMLSARNG